jgi:hypothetical protein
MVIAESLPSANHNSHWTDLVQTSFGLVSSTFEHTKHGHGIGFFKYLNTYWNWAL